MFGRSVSLRLILLSSAWIIAALVVGGAVLTNYFRDHVEANFDRGLNAHVEELLSYSEVINDTFELRSQPGDAQYQRPLSGWYWQVAGKGNVLARSRSLWDQVLEDVARPQRGERRTYYMLGPRDEDLRVSVATYSLPGHDEDVTIIVTGPARVIQRAVEEFNEVLITSLMFLGLGLAVAVVLQVVLGLKPLKQMRKNLVAIHSGDAARMTGSYPSEVLPLVDDLNQLLEHNAEVIERARTHAGNLAHALKTPLAVLQNEADVMAPESRATISEQTQVMNELITRHLSRARAAGALGAPGAHADVGDIASALKRTLQRIYAGRGIAISLVDVRGLQVVGDRQDLEEMLGNLIDNACKWSSGRVRVSAETRDKYVLLSVEDDGPGIPDAQLEEVLGRGKRLDEQTPGSGLGLNIVLELAELYGGGLKLMGSELGGLCAQLKLPTI